MRSANLDHLVQDLASEKHFFQHCIGHPEVQHLCDLWVLCLLGTFCCLRPCHTAGPFFSPPGFTLDPCWDKQLLDSEIWIDCIKVFCCFRLIFAIGMVPIQGLNMLCQYCVLLFCKNQHQAMSLCWFCFACVYHLQFGWSVLAVKLRKYWTYAFTSSLLPYWDHLQLLITFLPPPFVHHPDLQSPVHSPRLSSKVSKMCCSSTKLALLSSHCSSSDEIDFCSPSWA